MNLPPARLLLIGICTLCATSSGVSQTTSHPTNQGASKTTKKSSTNPKKATSTKNAADGDKVKTDDRLSTRGLKPAPKDADTGKPATPPKDEPKP